MGNSKNNGLKGALFAGLLVGIIAGAAVTGIALSLSGERMMIKEIQSPFDLEKTVKVLTERIGKEPGWHVVAVYDQQSEVMKHGGGDIGPMKIVEYCSGQYAGQMLVRDEQKKISTILPKSFTVYEKSNGNVYLATMNGQVIGKLFHGEPGEIVEKVSLEVEDILSFVFTGK